MRAGDGTGEAMVKKYFDTVGWPTFLPTSGAPLAPDCSRQKCRKRLQQAQQAEVPQEVAAGRSAAAGGLWTPAAGL
jgi:hypothetical protein